MDITYQLIVLNIFQESEADIEDFMQQKLEAEEGVGLFLDTVNIGLCFNILYTCILYMHLVLFDWICHKIFTKLLVF